MKEAWKWTICKRHQTLCFCFCHNYLGCFKHSFVKHFPNKWKTLDRLGCNISVWFDGGIWKMRTCLAFLRDVLCRLQLLYQFGCLLESHKALQLRLASTNPLSSLFIQHLTTDNYKINRTHASFNLLLVQNISFSPDQQHTLMLLCYKSRLFCRCEVFSIKNF